jgi:15-cis-phytoene synthase
LADEAAEDLDGLIRRVDPDRWLTSRFIASPAARADVVALYAYDHELVRARRVARAPLLAEIRLTWWREALDEIFAAGPVRRHPVAEALASAVRRHDLPRQLLEAMIDAQLEALEAPPTDEPAALAWADGVEGSLARLASKVLDPSADAAAAAAAGRAWGLALLIRAGLATIETVQAPLRGALDEARLAAKAVSAAALPALLPARLARFDLARRTPGPFRRRLSLVLAAAAGRV